MGKNNHRRQKGIKIIDPKKIDYTFTEHSSNIKSSSYNDGTNIGSLGKSKTERMDIDRLRHDIIKDTKIRTKGRIAADSPNKVIRLCMNKEATMEHEKENLTCR